MQFLMFSLLGFSSSILEAYFKARPYILFARACLYENGSIWKAEQQNYQTDAETNADSCCKNQVHGFHLVMLTHVHLSSVVTPNYLYATEGTLDSLL